MPAAIDLKSLLRPVGAEDRDYLHDESKTVGTAESISRPTSEAEIRAVLRHFREQGGRVTVQGNRTGLTAASVPDGGHILSLGAMDRALGLRLGADGAAFLRVQPGLSLFALRRMLALRDFGAKDWDAASREALAAVQKLPPLYFPPDPTEASASLGGMAACNASGAKTFHYGPTRPFIEGFRLVLADGDVIALRRGEAFAAGRSFAVTTEGGRTIRGQLPGYTMPKCKNASGYYAADDMDLVDLFVGSDGTLGVFSELELRLIPAPKAVWGINCFFREEEAMLRFVEGLKAWPEPPAAIEYFDGNALAILRAHDDGAFPVPEGFDSMIYTELHCPDGETARARLRDLGALMDAVGADSAETWAARSLPERERLLALRHKVPESVNALIAERKRSIPGLAKVGSDMAVPDGAFRRVLAMYHRDLAKRGFQYAVWGHIGNNHLHVNVLPRSMEEMRAGKEMFLDWGREVCALGGTTSAEHGAGKLKAGLLPLLYGEQGVREMAVVKRCFDPKCVLGAGNLFPPEWVTEA